MYFFTVYKYIHTCKYVHIHTYVCAFSFATCPSVRPALWPFEIAGVLGPIGDQGGGWEPRRVQ